MLALLLLLEAIDALVCFTQSCNVYICNFISPLEQCRGHLFTLYQNTKIQFCCDEFHSFNMLLQMNHESIPLQWDHNLNLPEETLAFVFGDQELHILHKGKEVTRQVIADLVLDIKFETSDVAQKVLNELTHCFPVVAILDALCIVYLQYWIQGDCEASF